MTDYVLNTQTTHTEKVLLIDVVLTRLLWQRMIEPFAMVLRDSSCCRFSICLEVSPVTLSIDKQLLQAESYLQAVLSLDLVAAKRGDGSL